MVENQTDNVSPSSCVSWSKLSIQCIVCSVNQYYCYFPRPEERSLRRIDARRSSFTSCRERSNKRREDDGHAVSTRLFIDTLIEDKTAHRGPALRYKNNIFIYNMITWCCTNISTLDCPVVQWQHWPALHWLHCAELRCLHHQLNQRKQLEHTHRIRPRERKYYWKEIFDVSITNYFGIKHKISWIKLMVFFFGHFLWIMQI